VAVDAALAGRTRDVVAALACATAAQGLVPHVAGDTRLGAARPVGIALAVHHVAREVLARRAARAARRLLTAEAIAAGCVFAAFCFDALSTLCAAVERLTKHRLATRA